MSSSIRELLRRETVAIMQSWQSDAVEGVSCQDFELALSASQPEEYWKDALYRLSMRIVQVDVPKVTQYLTGKTLIASCHQEYLPENHVRYHADFYIKREMHEKTEPNITAPATIILSEILGTLGLIGYWECGITVKLLKGPAHTFPGVRIDYPPPDMFNTY